MAEALGRVEVEISANTAQFEQALARARALAAGLKDMQIGGGGGGAGGAANALKNFNNSAQGASSALATLIAQNKVLAVGFHTVAGALSAIQGPLGPIAGRFGFLGTLIGRVGVGFAGFGVAVAGAVLSVNEAIDAFAEEEKQLLTLNAVLKATQGASGQTAGSLADLADAISTTTLATDDQVRSAEALMLTFRKISGEEFPRAMRAAQDLAATGFGSIEGNARQLGRALEDPVRGLGALRRSGVTFSESQRTLIKSLVESGNVVEAQRKVLQAIEIQVGGAGAAQAGGVSGAYHRLSEAVNNVTVSMGGWLERTLHVSAYADSAANALNSMVQGTDDLAVSIGGVTYQTKKLESAREESDRKQKERLDYAKLEFEQAAADAAYEAQQQAVLRFAQTPQVQGKAPVTFTTGFEADAVKTDEQIKLQNALTAAIGQFAQAISYAHQAVTGFMADYAALKKAEDALNQSMEEGLTALREERDELMRTNEQRRIHDVLVKNELNNNKEQARTLAAVTAAQYELNQAMSDLASAGGPVDELKARYASMIAMMQQGAGIQMSQVGILKLATNTAIALTDEQIRTQERADALSRTAKNAVEQKAAAEQQEAAKFIEGETEKHRLQRITIAGHKAELDAINSIKEADESRLLQQKQNLENAQLDLELVGKSIGEQTRLRTEVQLTQELQRRQILEHIAYTKEDIKAVDELAAKMGDFAQKTAAANLQMQTDFASQSMFLSQTEQKVAQAMQGSFGDQWQAHMHDATANQIRFNAVLQDTYSATRDFAGTFTEGMLAGKSATDSLTDALGNLQKKLIDMALDAVIQGLFGLLLGQGTTGGNIFSNLVNVASGGGTSANTSKAPRRYAEGGVVGSTPRPLYKGEPLAYDEYPAILHTGETVVPVGGKNLHLSGKDMTEMFGGVPKLEGGWNAAAEAAGGYQAGDTGATGHWGTTSGGGGNVSLSNLAASQFTSTGGGSISLGSGHSGGGGSISVPIPRLRIAAPRIVAPAPIVVAPVIAPVVTPIVAQPLGSITPTLEEALAQSGSWQVPAPPVYTPDLSFIPAPPITGYYPEFDTSQKVATRTQPASPHTPTPVTSYGTGTPTVGTQPSYLAPITYPGATPASTPTAVPGGWSEVQGSIHRDITTVHTLGNQPAFGAGGASGLQGYLPRYGTGVPGGHYQTGFPPPGQWASSPLVVPTIRSGFPSQLGYGAGLGAARYPFRIATDPRRLVKNVIAPTNPDIDVIPPVFGGLPVQPGLGLYPPPPSLPLPRSDATMGPMTQIDTGKTGFGQIGIPALRLFNSIFGIGQSNQPLPEPAPKAPAPYDDGGAKANIKEQYDSIMKGIKRGSTGPSSMLDPRAAGQLAGGTDDIIMAAAIRAQAEADSGGASLEEQMSRTPEYYKALVSGAFDTGPPFGYGADVRAMLSQTDMDRKLAHGWRTGSDSRIGYQSPDERAENERAIYGMPIVTHFDRLTRLSTNIEDRRPRDAAGNLIGSSKVYSTRPPPADMSGPEGQAWMREQNEAFERLRPNYEAVGSRVEHLRDPGMAIQPAPMFSSGGVVGSTPVPHGWVSSMEPIPSFAPLTAGSKSGAYQIRRLDNTLPPPVFRPSDEPPMGFSFYDPRVGGYGIKSDTRRQLDSPIEPYGSLPRSLNAPGYLRGGFDDPTKYPYTSPTYQRIQEMKWRSFDIHHGGGVVGSTPVPHRWLPSSLFDNAPRFQAGLAANEYPAILHAGETVTPVSGQQRSSGNVIINSPAQAPPNVTVNVTNNSNAQVSTNNSQDSNGGVKIDIIIDEMVAAKMRDGGSQISRTLGSMGARSQPVRR